MNVKIIRCRGHILSSIGYEFIQHCLLKDPYYSFHLISFQLKSRSGKRLNSLSLEIELKPFFSISNLNQFRYNWAKEIVGFLRQSQRLHPNNIGMP